MNKFRAVLAVIAAAVSIVSVATAQAAVSHAAVTVDSSLVTPVADGCGPNGWRGRWGHCHYNGGWSYVPGYVRAPVYNGCPPGYWHGPWGHCRNTPYHGRLPGGGWR